MTDIKLCINCKHSRLVGFTGSVVACHHPESDAWVISPVNGKVVWNPVSVWKGYCEVTRSDSGYCGPVGKCFEQKEEKLSLFGKIFNFIKNGPLG